MLILARKQGERIILETQDGPVTIQVVKVDGGLVRVGLDAPLSVRIWREELKQGGGEESD